jgi:flagellin
MSSLKVATIASSQLANNVSKAQSSVQKSVSKISSGYRLTDAGADAAGYSISSRLQNDQVGIKKAIENTHQGISMLQTADGSLSQISSMLVRMRELAVQSSTETYTDSDRSMLDAEYTNLFKEIDRVAADTTFNNTINLLSSTDNSFIVQVGYLSNLDHRIFIDFINLNSDTTTIGMNASPDLSTQSNAMTAINTIDAALNSMSEKRTFVGSYLNRLESTLADATNLNENLTGSLSRIVDVDYAVESASMTQNQILRQASVAALAQAKNVNASHFQSIFSNL